MNIQNMMPSKDLIRQLQLIEKVTQEFTKEPENKSREQFEAEIEIIKQLLDHTKALFPVQSTQKYGL